MDGSFRRTGRVVLALVGPALAALLSIANATTVRFCTPDAQSMPDPLHVADSATGIAFARCTFVDGVHPARFRMEQLLGGTLPDSFTVRGHGYYIKGERCPLILVRRSKCMDLIGPQYRRYVQDFDAITMPTVTGEFPGTMGRPDQEKALQIAASLWHPTEQTPQELRRRLHLWLWRTGGACEPTLASEVLTRHPELRDSVMVSALLERCRGPESWWGREMSARALGMRPDPAIRMAARAMRAGDVDDRYTAVLLVAGDKLQESRAWLVATIRDTSELVAETAIQALEPGTFPSERDALVEYALEAEAAIRQLRRTTGAEGEWVSDSLGQLMVQPNHLRAVALRQLGSDTSSTVRGAISRIIHEPSYYCCESGEDWSDDAILTLDAAALAQCWTRSELVTALSDSIPRIRTMAYREAVRRKDTIAGSALLDQLRGDRLSKGPTSGPEELKEMIEALGAIADTAAVPELIRRADLPNALAFNGTRNWELRAAAVDALGNIDDPRAIDLLRKLASSVLDDTVWVQSKWNALYGIPKALTSHGDYRDVPFFKKMAKLNADQFATAAGGIASVAGPEAFFQFLEENKVRKLKLTDALFIDAGISGACRERDERREAR